MLYRLITLMESLGQSWTDNLPISETEPFTFKEGYDTQVAQLKRDLEINEYATAEECMYWLSDQRFYDLWDYDAETRRKLAGIRYEMVLRDFSLENTYVFASDVGSVARDTILEHSYELPGVDVVESPIREYVDGTLAPTSSA